MQSLLRDHDLERLARAVHQIKGAAGGYGFPQITVAAARAEESIKRAEDAQSVCGQIGELIGLIRRVEGFPQSAIPVLSVKSPEIQAAASAAEPGSPARRGRVDQVTGLANRLNLMERLSAEIAMARRQGSPLACIAIQISQFETIKGQQSEQAANGVIKRIGQALEARCRGDCDVFRAAAAQLVILAPKRDFAASHALADEIGNVIAAERFGDLIGDWKLSCVLGVAELELTTSCAAELLEATMKSLTASRSPASARSGST
jgi:diguanylate cyclase (GGDEF)-like protein